MQKLTQVLYRSVQSARQALRAATAASIVEHEYVCPQQATVPLEVLQVPLAVVHCSVGPDEQTVLHVWDASALRIGSTLKVTVRASRTPARENALFILPPLVGYRWTHRGAGLTTLCGSAFLMSPLL